MKQKLALVRALLHRPSLLLLDEPTAGLDVPSAAAVRDDLATLAAREGVTVFLTTHNMAEAERLCSQVAVIRQGKLVALGPPGELRAQRGGSRVEILGRGFTEPVLGVLRRHPQVAAVEAQNGRLVIELCQQMAMAPLVNLLVESGCQVEEVRRGKASLEEVFLELMVVDPRQGVADPRQGAADPRQGVADPRQGAADPRQGVVDPRQGTMEPLAKEKKQ